MAATAGGVAIGSTVGHGISSLLFGGGGAAQEQQQPMQQQQQQQNQPSCAAQAKDFTMCLEKADLQSCSYYLEQLKAVSLRLISLSWDESLTLFVVPDHGQPILTNSPRNPFIGHTLPVIRLRFV
jgi:hypothetical protein